ncbi:hypothetical protein GCM10022276_20600 [Sphingomonas limnosediminicola]|jgi:hypothetical protein|uniref:PilZ domain-containing protein n=1 Tax=Sphingomonas limnosediminicola TaxID=940133 RepID=A0ABP7LH17_9SPHN
MNIRAKIFGGSPLVEDPILGTKKPKGAKAGNLDSVEMPREAGHRINSRGEDRHRVIDKSARVTHKNKSREVQLVNVSGGGAMISTTVKLVPWDRLELHLGPNGTIECSVLWVKDGRAGLEFAHETHLDCSANEQAQVLREVIKQNFPEVQYRACEKQDEVKPAETIDDQRSDRRHPLIWSGTLHYDYESTPVRLRNISQMGATIETSLKIEPGAEPLLDLGEAGTVFGVVAWSIGDQVGLTFKEPFDLSALAKSRPRVAPSKWQPPSHILKSMRAGAPEPDRWDRLSLNELNDELEGFLKH